MELATAFSWDFPLLCLASKSLGGLTIPPTHGETLPCLEVGEFFLGLFPESGNSA